MMKSLGPAKRRSGSVAVARAITISTCLGRPELTGRSSTARSSTPSEYTLLRAPIGLPARSSGDRKAASGSPGRSVRGISSSGTPVSARTAPRSALKWMRPGLRSRATSPARRNASTAAATL